MDVKLAMDQVRGVIRSWCIDHGSPSDATLSESLLLHNGFLRGRRFLLAPFRIEWDSRDDRLHFYDATGQLVDELTLASTPLNRPVPKAA